MTFKTRLSVLPLSTPVLAFVLVGGLMGTPATRRPPTSSLPAPAGVRGRRRPRHEQLRRRGQGRQGHGRRDARPGRRPRSRQRVPQPRPGQAVEAGEAPPEGDVGIELTRQYYLRVIAARDGSPARRPACRPATTSARSTASRRATCRSSKAARCCAAQPGSKVTLTVIRGNAAEPHEVELVREKVAGPLVTSQLHRHRRRLPPHRLVPQRRRRGTAEAGRRPDEVRRQEPDHRPPPHGRRPARERHRGGAAVRQVRHAGDQGRPRQDRNARASIGRKPATARSTLPCRCSSRPARQARRSCSPPRWTATSARELIGERTLGRAGIQKLVKLPDGRGLWLTYARYLTPKGKPIQGKGLEPDVAVDEPDVEFGAPAPTTIRSSTRRSSA